ncbi:MAG: hypothetical protein HKM89_15605 [Gemmatimonadales bacterium]|nr:hypothetical protein [Gemmatimonadales bacterium]
MVLGYLASGLLGLQLAAPEGSPLAEPAAATALTFAFRSDVGPSPIWHRIEGTSTHGWLVRRAYVRGVHGTAEGTRYSEQVLKVGWPFTMVRGFVRLVGTDERRDGVLVVRGDPSAGPVRLLPIQPVWPGLIINSLWLAAVFLAVTELGRRLVGARRAPP